jgi:putative ABC transport system permease protein
MIRNYMAVAIRNLTRDRLTSVINVGGLAVGIACCTLIFLYVEHEWTFDRHLEHVDELGRLVLVETRKSGSVRYRGLHENEVAEYLMEDYSEVVAASAFISVKSMLTYEGESKRVQTGGVHPTFIDMFSVEFIAGDRETALDKPESIALSRSAAARLFGVEQNADDLIGRSLNYAGRPNPVLTVTGIFEDAPKKSSLSYDVLVPVRLARGFPINTSANGDSEIYIQFDSSDRSAAFEEKLESFAASRLPKKLEKAKSRLAEDGYQLRIQPMKDVYLGGDYRWAWGYRRSGDPDRAYQLSRLALLVLAIASVNFVVMSISRSTERSLEVGIRKVMGAGRFQLMRQHWSESILTSGLATALAFGLVELFTPTFRDLSGIPVSLANLDWQTLALFSLGVLFVLGVLAGAYPALILSGFTPVSAIKGETKMGGRQKFTRTMVIFQYAIVIGLMICAGVMSDQLNHFKDFDLGYEQEQVAIVYPGNRAVKESFLFMEKAEAVPAVLSTAASDRDFISGSWSTTLRDDESVKRDVRLLRVTPGYFETLGIPLLEGRGFRDGSTADQTSHIVVNASLVERFEWTSALGQSLSGVGGDDYNPTVIGVCKDFHFDSLHKKIRPLMLHANPEMNGIWAVFVRIGPNDISETIDQLETIWAQVAPDRPFDLRLLDDRLDEQYRKEQRWQDVFSYASGFAILIACMGLFAQASVAMRRRTKEVGIRKAVGASITQLVRLLTLEFAVLVIVANLLAWPAAYYWLDSWLTGFAYRVDLSVGSFMLGSGLALTIAMVTVGMLGVRAAKGNPVEALRYE